MDMSGVSAVIDVRTADEWAGGHLDGAVNIDLQSADFASKIDALDHAANYVVYCHSGNRAGQAINYMQGAGFTGELMNAGGVADAAGMTGMKVVQ
jgi:rhodanese-related sulfurtransferase